MSGNNALAISDLTLLQAKVRARLSRPLQRGKGKSHPRGDHKGSRVAGRRPRAPWNRPLPRPLPARARGLGGRVPVAVGRGFKRPVGIRDRRPPPHVPARARPVPPPPRSYERRAPGTHSGHGWSLLLVDGSVIRSDIFSTILCSSSTKE